MTTATTPQTEPWLRGTHSELPAVLRAVLHAFELANEDTHYWTGDLSESELHSSPLGLTTIAFHLRHIPRSLDRLLTYAEGDQLSFEQILALKTECDPDVSRGELFSEFNVGLTSAARRVRAFAATDLDQLRGVGKKQLPTSIGGLLVHLADHTQRHTGQVVTTAKVLKAMREAETPVAVHGLT
jgi:DinB superfamily